MRKNATILLVEDNADDEALILRALNKHTLGDQVVVARDGAEALDFFLGRDDPQDLPQLTLLDIGLPKVNGLEVLRRLRARERTRLLPIVLFSSSDDKQDLIEGYDSGANSYIQKPVTFAQLVELIGQIRSYWLGLNEAPPLLR